VLSASDRLHSRMTTAGPTPCSLVRQRNDSAAGDRGRRARRVRPVCDRRGRALRRMEGGERHGLRRPLCLRVGQPVDVSTRRTQRRACLRQHVFSAWAGFGAFLIYSDPCTLGGQSKDARALKNCWHPSACHALLIDCRLRCHPLFHQKSSIGTKLARTCARVGSRSGAVRGHERDSDPRYSFDRDGR
jgi:hypothetical protein